MSDTAIAKVENPFEPLAVLRREGMIDRVSLVLEGEVSYDRWEALLSCVGEVEQSSRWWIGDLINWGEALFGEESSQAFESTLQDRYDLAERVTGLAPATLMNYASICSRIARERRRVELPFSTHEPVASLDAKEQKRWLGLAVKNGWSKGQLRDEIRAAADGDDVPPDDPLGGTYEVSVPERIEQAARLCFHQAQVAEDGSAVVPPSAWAQLVAALGEGE